MPAAQQISPRLQTLGRPSPGEQRDLGLHPALVHPALETQRVAIGNPAVQPDASAREIPRVVGITTRRINPGFGVSGFAEDSKCQALADSVPVAHAGAVAFLVSGGSLHRETLRVLGALG